eukprot:CAMPEP_0185604160 /NCGR_PEP_ID=MMETSP0436-20130131/3078_1 /TAXON_ID=626734 ORGANISM="Favella taraikaensis, Strain Fe Narragansett Bay" /NCGR_SAMPLE_ID=MMETSP0436 /ASSEMBLY_ACC=CAM_ASM_000390 /LENGTH=123 /DNA_ID=CAMNT_0028234903 /DNA_START=567 /DNA_END=937 /DNA_ORIENTATION=-
MKYAASLLEVVAILAYLFEISIGLLVVVELPPHALFLLAVLALGPQSAPVALDEEGGVLALLFDHVVDVPRVQVLNEVVLATHRLNPLLNLVALLQQGPLLRLELVEFVVHGGGEHGVLHHAL